MTSLPRRASSARIFGLASVALLALGLAACEDKHIGRLCDIGSGADGGSGNTGLSNQQALECPSRICILPVQQMTTDTEAFCTAECESDDDCSDAEVSANAMDKSDKRCNTKFYCRRVFPKLQTNPLACKRLCVCGDFLNLSPNAPPDNAAGCS